MRSAEPWESICTLSEKISKGKGQRLNKPPGTNRKWERKTCFVHTGSVVPNKQTDEVTDGGLAFGEMMEASRGRFFGLFSRRELVQCQMILMFK